MYVVFDYACSRCETVEEIMLQREKKDAVYCTCCGQKMVRLPAGPPTHFRFADDRLKR